MPSKVRSALNILINEDFNSLISKTRRHFGIHTENRIREIQGPAANLYDCFIFYKEFDLLEIRMGELHDIVDYFVIVEADETFQGDEKPLYFKQKKNQFEKYENKIIYKSVEYPAELSSPWEREAYLRDSISEAVRDAGIEPQDEIMVSDADEIPSLSGIKRALQKTGVKIFSQTHHNYFYNAEIIGNYQWLGPVMTEYGNFTSAKDFRVRFSKNLTTESKLFVEVLNSLAYRTNVNVIPDGGWHFSFLGDVDFIVDKLESYSHTERNKEKHKDKKKIREKMLKGEDLMGRNYSFEFVELNDEFPKFLRNNKNKYKENIANLDETI